MRPAFVARRWAGMCRDGGYVLAMSALLIIPLMAFTGLAVDVGAWYARAAEIQKTADAAALAGVAALPTGTNAALTAAREVAAQNGFVHDPADPDGIKVWGNPVGDELERYEVVIVDGDVAQYFTTLFRVKVTIERRSVAEYIPPIRMGSPRNFLGTGTLPNSVSGLPTGAIKEEFMLAVNSPCDRLEDGDLRLSERMGTNGAGNYCTGGADNPDDRDEGYLYGVKVEPGYSSGPITIEVFDAAYCPRGGSAWHDFRISSGAWFETRFRTRDPAPNPYEGSVRTDRTVGGTNSTGSDSGDCDDSSSGWRNHWRELDTISNPQPGDIYTIQVQSLNHSNSGSPAGSNNFALRARTGSSFVACSADIEDTDGALRPGSEAAAAQCPNVFAFEDLSVFANSESNVAEFFLASIGPEHSGKTLVIDLFDPGEGGELLRIQDPNGNLIGPGNVIGDGKGGTIPGITSFERSVVQRFATEQTPGGGWGPVTESVVEIYHRGPSAGTGRANDTRCSGTGPACRYNERQLRIEIQLPANIDAAYGGRTWWRIHYQFNGAVTVTDRTTWSVQVMGDPVRLIE